MCILVESSPQSAVNKLEIKIWMEEANRGFQTTLRIGGKNMKFGGLIWKHPFLGIWYPKKKTKRL